MSYMFDPVDLHVQAASYIDPHPQGSQPGRPPGSGADKFMLIINLKTAKALGLDVPQSILVRADEVIE